MKLALATQKFVYIDENGASWRYDEGDKITMRDEVFAKYAALNLVTELEEAPKHTKKAEK